MTENTQEQEHEHEAREPVDSDGILQLFASMANDIEGFGVAITLTVGGALVTGELVGRDSWLDAYVRVHHESGQGAGQFAEQLRRMVVEGSEGLPKPEAGEFNYLHLTDAQVVEGDRFIPGEQEGLWRVRIDRVDGWAPGRLAGAD